MPNMYEMMDWDLNIDNEVEVKEDTNLFKERHWVELYKRGDLSRDELLQEFPYLEGEANVIDLQGDQFWRVVGQESYGNGYIATHIEWPSDRLICMKDGEGDKHVLVPTFDIRSVENSRQDLVTLLIDDNRKNVQGNLKHIYTFSIRGYDHLFGMVAFTRESEPVTDFFEKVQALRECTESCFKSY